jgi:hypothetical protein
MSSCTILCPLPGCSVESIIFFALHRSGVISLICPCLYAVTSCFACSSPTEDVNSILIYSIISEILIEGSGRAIGLRDGIGGSGTHHTD